MRHERDYDRPQAGRDGVLWTTPDPPWQTVTGPAVSWQLDIRPGPERQQEQIDELRRRVAQIENLIRWTHEQ